MARSCCAQAPDVLRCHRMSRGHATPELDGACWRFGTSNSQLRTASFRSRPQITYTVAYSSAVHHSILPNAPLPKAVPAKNDVAQLPRCLAASTAAAASRAATKSSDRSWPVSGCAVRSWVQFGSKLCFAGSVCQLSFRRVCLQESLVTGPSDACSDLLGCDVILQLFGTRCHFSSFAVTHCHAFHPACPEIDIYLSSL